MLRKKTKINVKVYNARLISYDNKKQFTLIYY